MIDRLEARLDSLVDLLNEERVRKVLEPILTGGVSFDPKWFAADGEDRQQH